METRAGELVRQASHHGDPARGLAALLELRRELEALEVAQVRDAVLAGWSWREIAGALGVSKQGAHQKHGTPRARPPRPAGDGDQRLVITGQARQVVEHAREEAAAAGVAAVETQHLLLGVLRSGDGPATTALRRAGVELDAARREARSYRRDDSETGDQGLPRRRLPVSDPARASFEQSLREAVGRDDRHLGVEHVLLALLCEHDGAAAQTLGRLGVAVGRLHRLLERTMAEGAGQAPQRAVSG